MSSGACVLQMKGGCYVLASTEQITPTQKLTEVMAARYQWAVVGSSYRHAQLQRRSHACVRAPKEPEKEGGT